MGIIQTLIIIIKGVINIKNIYLVILLLFVLIGCQSIRNESILSDLSIQKRELTEEPLTDSYSQSQIDLILIEHNRETTVLREVLKFTEHGLIKGVSKLMIPIINDDRIGLSKLGISTTLSLKGTFCRLEKGDSILDFDMNSLTCFKDNEPVSLLDDIPFYNNGTLYIPFETVLDGFGISFKYEENKIIIKEEDFNG